VIRILLIGRVADSWANRLAAHARGVDFDVARLPAAGIRQLEQTPPDAVVVFEDGGTDRLFALVDAIKKRPLGALTPVIVVSNDALSDTQRQSLDVAAWIDLDANEDVLLKALAERLGVEVGELTTQEIHRPAGSTAPPSPSQTQGHSRSQPAQTAAPLRVETNDFVIEEIPEDRGPRTLTAGDIFPQRFSGGNSDELNESELRRKLKSVRHEDYFVILEVPRGAETAGIREAFHRMTGRFHNTRIPFDLQHRYHAELGEVRDAFEDAWAVLGDPKLRQEYLEHTTRR
jgi:hypothetical protein